MTTPVDEALHEWALPVCEPPGPGWQRITAIIHEGLPGFSCSDPPWGADSVYERDHQFGWCGAGVAYCHRHHVSAEIRRRHWSSPYRLYRWARGTQRYLSRDALQPSDLAIVGTRRRWGSHVFLVEAVRGDELHTIEFNGVGIRGDGSHGHGVVRRVRSLHEVRYGVRPLAEDS